MSLFYVCVCFVIPFFALFLCCFYISDFLSCILNNQCNINVIVHIIDEHTNSESSWGTLLNSGQHGSHVFQSWCLLNVF